MGLGIEIDNEKMDLPPDAQLEIEHPNPLLQFTDEIVGGLSLPLTIKANEKNQRLTRYAGHIQKRITNNAIDAMLWDNNVQMGRGTVKIEKNNASLNDISRSGINIYFLTGVASFYQDVKGIKLSDVDLGGNRSFEWHDFNTGVAGFWKHIHDVMNGSQATYDYAFYPVINKEWISDDQFWFSEVLNNVSLVGGVPNFTHYGTDAKMPNAIVPFPYLKYVMTQALAHVGWTMDGAILDDEDFIKITMLSERDILWCDSYGRGGGVYELVPLDVIEFDLKDYMPDMGIGEFFIALKNRFGLWYDIDFKQKKIHVTYLKDSAAGVVKDFTKAVNPILVKTYNTEKKNYSLINKFFSDLGGGAPDFTILSVTGELAVVGDLPAADEAHYNNVYLVVSENNYYICIQNTDTNAFEWEILAYNIYDYKPAGDSEEITTAATTTGVEKYNAYLDLIPRLDFTGNGARINYTDNPWGLCLLFYHGIRENKANQNYPYASSHIYDSKNIQVADWSLSFFCKKHDGNDVGLYRLNWKSFIDTLNSGEEFEMDLQLSQEDFLKLKFSDRINIKGVQMFIIEIKNVVPYKGKVSVKCLRI